MTDRGAFDSFKEHISTPDLPSLGPASRTSVLPPAEIDKLVNAFAEDARIPTDRAELIRALVLLWHDHLDASHRVSQDIGSPDGSFVHGIMHRREPDYGNAKYWFRRAGDHPAFPEIRRRAGRLTGAAAESLLKGAMGNRWDSFAFVDACERVVGKPETGEEQMLLRQIQKVEFDVLLEQFPGFGAND